MDFPKPPGLRHPIGPVVLAAFLFAAAAVAPTHQAAAAAPDALATAEAMVERDAQTLRRSATRLVASRLSDPFRQMEARAPNYADWVYGWLSSIWISFDIFRVGAWEVGTQIYNTEAPDIAAVRGELEAYVVDEFERQVIVPELTERQLLSAWDDTIERVRNLDERLARARLLELDRSIRTSGDTRTMDASILTAARELAATPLLTAWNPDRPPTLRTAPDAGILDPTSSEHARADMVLTRSFRPLATRVLSVGSRFVIVPLIGGAVVVPGLETGGAAAATALTVMVLTGLWTADYAANWADAALNRPGFVADLQTSIRAAQARTVIEARDHIVATLCPDLPGC